MDFFCISYLALLERLLQAIFGTPLFARKQGIRRIDGRVLRDICKFNDFF